MSRELLSRCFPIALVCLLLSFGCSDRSTDAPAALTVSGTVLDPVTLNGIPGATVSVIDADKGDILAQTVTAQNGSFRVDQLPKLRLYVLVEADGYQVTDQTVYDPARTDVRPTEVSVMMKTSSGEPCCTGVLTVTAKDPLGNPIDGATVKVWKNGQLLKSAVTGADGKASITNLCAGEYGASVTKTGLAEKEFKFGINTNCDPVEKSVEMGPGPCCSGVYTLTVVDGSGNPIPGAAVKIRKSGNIVAQLTTDATGKIVADNLCGGEYVVNVTKDNFTAKELKFAINANCDPVTQTVALEPGPCCTGRLTVTVRDKNGNLVQGANVKIAKAGAVIASVLTDAAGKAVIENLCGGAYSGWIIKSGFNTKEFTFTIGADCAPVALEFTLEGSPCCSGVFTLTVKDANGNPIAGATVKIWMNGALLRTGTTNADGKAVFDGLCKGTYGVDVTKDGYTHKELQFAINENCDPVTKDVVLENGPCCSGVFTLTVKDANGNPIAGATVKIFQAGAVIKTVTTGADGKAVAENLCKGTYGVDVTKDGYTHKELQFEINANCDPVTKDVVLESGPCCSGVFTLTVKDASGNPVAGATVKLMKNGSVLQTGATNADGKAVFDGLCAGDYTILVKKDGFAAKDLAFTINANCDPVTRDMTLEAVCCSGTFTLTVKDKNGAPIVGAKVQIMQAGAVIRTETTNGEGKITVVNLCKGEYVAKVTKDTYTAGSVSFEINANCDPVTKDITLEPIPCCSGVLTVTVTDVNGNPIAGATVKLFKSGQLLKTLTTDVLGKAIFDALCKAEYGVDVLKEGYNHQEFSFGINASCDPVTKTVALTQ